ncbi:MAG: gluconeogenesis factor YvcK family protein [Planctomycetota bacterium]
MFLDKFLKWWRPGLRIKRWIAVILLGIFFALGASYALFMFAIGTPGHDVGNALLFGSALSFLLSGFCLITGIYRLMKSMWGLVDRQGDRGGLVEAAYQRAVLASGPKVVAIGGGTGLSCVLTGLKKYSRDITAIVSMADDGGSSGKLRQELGINPPGDVRKCLIALADEESAMNELMEFRFPEHELGGHNFGNLLLTALARIRGDFGEGVREANRIFSVRGQVLPGTLDRVLLVATHEDDTKTTGQALISKTQKRIKRLELRPDPEPVAQDILKAIAEAQLIVIGPGSLYTSVIPNLLIRGMAEALARSSAKKIFVCNIMTYEGETRGYDLSDFLKAVDEHTYPHRVYDYVLVNNGKHGDTGLLAVKERHAQSVRYEKKIYDNGSIKLVANDVVNSAYPIRHDTAKLSQAIMEILKAG